MKIFLTGATSGVGMALARQLLAQGHALYATGRSGVALRTLAAEGATVIQADVTQSADRETLYAALPVVDVAIFCAGVGRFEDFTTQSDATIEEMVTVNVTATAQLARHFAAQMTARGRGQLIFIGSQAGKVATPKAVVYAATKHAIVGLANGLRLELAPQGVQVTAIHPGPIDTPFLTKADDTNSYRASVKRVLLSPERVATEVIKTLGKPVREVNLPRIMGVTSKLYALCPRIIERVGKSFFYKK